MHALRGYTGFIPLVNKTNTAYRIQNLPQRTSNFIFRHSNSSMDFMNSPEFSPISTAQFEFHEFSLIFFTDFTVGRGDGGAGIYRPV